MDTAVSRRSRDEGFTLVRSGPAGHFEGQPVAGSSTAAAPRTRLVIMVIAMCHLGALVLLAPADRAAATPSFLTGDPESSPSRAEVLQVTSVTPWVAAEGTFRVSFSTADLPTDATVTTTIHQRLATEEGTLREATENQLRRGARSRNLQAPLRVPLTELLTGEGTAEIAIPVRSGSGDPGRQLIPTPGIHPVTIEVSRPVGDVVAAASVFLNRLPEDMPEGRDALPATTAVQMLATLDSGPALGADGRTELSTEESLAVSAWEVMLTENRDLPLTVALRPNTLLGLQRGDIPEGTSFVSELPRSAFTVASQSYVKVDAAALMDAGTGALEHQLATGAAILRRLTGAPPAGIWMFDDTVDTEAAELLKANGVEHLFVSEDRLAIDSDAGQETKAVLKRNRTLALAGVRGVTVSSYDAEITRLLLEAELPPGLRAHRATTALMASWFDAVRSGPDAFPGVSSAVVLSPGTDREVLSAFVAGLSEPGPLAVSRPPAPTVDASGEEEVARLRMREVDSAAAVVDRWRSTATRISGYASMTAPGDPTTTEWNLVNDQTTASDIDLGARSSMWNSVDAAIDEKIAMIQTPPPRSVVLTSRSGSIPLRLRNRGEEPVTVRLTTRSPRLDFPEGASSDILLTPGENRVDIPVEVQAPGSSLMRIELTSPDGVLDIREVQVRVRSSSISGVGAVLSIISLAVLALWWIRTFLKRRNTPDARLEETGPNP